MYLSLPILNKITSTSSKQYFALKADIALVPNGIDEDGNTIPSTAICKETKEIFARSRYMIQSKIDSFNAKTLEKAILDSIKKSAESEGAETIEWSKQDTEYKATDWIELIKPYYKAIFSKFPEKAKEVVALELGENKKVSAATDEDIVALENIYNQFVTFAGQQGIKIEG